MLLKLKTKPKKTPETNKKLPYLMNTWDKLDSDLLEFLWKLHLLHFFLQVSVFKYFCLQWTARGQWEGVFQTRLSLESSDLPSYVKGQTLCQ